MCLKKILESPITCINTEITLCEDYGIKVKKVLFLN